MRAALATFGIVACCLGSRLPGNDDHGRQVTKGRTTKADETSSQTCLRSDSTETRQEWQSEGSNRQSDAELGNTESASLQLESEANSTSTKGEQSPSDIVFPSGPISDSSDAKTSLAEKLSKHGFNEDMLHMDPYMRRIDREQLELLRSSRLSRKTVERLSQEVKDRQTHGNTETAVDTRNDYEQNVFQLAQRQQEDRQRHPWLERWVIDNIDAFAFVERVLSIFAFDIDENTMFWVTLIVRILQWLAFELPDLFRGDFSPY